MSEQHEARLSGRFPSLGQVKTFLSYLLFFALSAFIGFEHAGWMGIVIGPIVAVLVLVIIFVLIVGLFASLPHHATGGDRDD